MTNGGDAAEQIVRLSLEGFEVAAKLTGSAAKNIAVLLAFVLKQEINQSGKTKGKARLTNMIKSGKELKVFAIPQKDLKSFTEHAKKYGVLYCVLRDKTTNAPDAPVDIIARAEDASKIQRIVERFELGKVDKASIITEAEKAVADRGAIGRNEPVKSQGEIIVEEALGYPNKERNANENPTAARTDKDHPFERNSDRDDLHIDKDKVKRSDKKPSVKERLERYKALAVRQKEERSKSIISKGESRKSKPKRQTVHHQPKTKKKPKER